MGQSEFIAALDLGTSKMVAMAGRKNEQGILSVLAAEKVETGACIRRGCVYNVEETANKVKKLISVLHYKLNNPIERVYVGIGGQSLRTEAYSITKEMPQGSTINQDLIESLHHECRLYQPEFAEILDIVSPEFYLDGRLEANPKGVQCSKIEARFQLILGRPSLKRSLQQSIEEKAKISIAGFIVTPIATAAAVLNDTEKELGCALIEFGAGITYLSVYKGGLLKYLIAIPLGSHVITNDICSLNVLEKEAEELKINFGSALVEFDNKIKIQTARLAEGLDSSREIALNKLNDVIESRVDEILSNVAEQLNQSGFSQSLGAGIVITGGGASLKNMAESIHNKTGKEVRISTAKKTLVNQAAELTQQLSNSAVVGLLSLGTINCAKRTEQTPKKQDTHSLFSDEEVEKKKPEEQPAQKASERSKDKKDSLFGKWSKKFDGFSKSLFDDEEEEK